MKEANDVLIMSAEESEGQKFDTKEDLELRARIDRSLRFPILFFFLSAAGWLVTAAVLGLLSSLALNLPKLFEGWSIFQYGRLQPAQMNAFLYGWAIQAGFGTGYWLIARLSRAPLRNPIRLLVGGCLWNCVVSLGVLAILFGWGTSVEWLDFPKAFWPVILICYLIIMLEMVALFAVRRNRDAFISQWYVLAAAFWFPWVYVTANGFIHAAGGAAVIKTAIGGWYVSNVLYMVLAPVALASAYYLVSKTTGRRIFSQEMAQLGFWTLVLFTGWTGFSRYMGGPLPAWMPAISGAAAVFLLIPCAAAVGNLFKTMEGKLSWATYSPSLRFTVFALFALILAVAMGGILATIPTGRNLQFTFARTSYEMLALYGFFSMAMFGAVYFILPRVSGCEWPSAGMIRFHFWLSVYGVLALVAFAFFAGLAQGTLQNQWETDFLLSVERTRPYLAALAIGWTLILISNLSFLFQLALMAIRWGRRSGEGPTLIHKEPSEYFSDPRIVEERANA